ncbi:hypothetical protein CFOL_v3_25580 [Cephalotus follicularis]|uniref:Uncharacterized protein n=1 Tax=Cephalotus follicularis TaxID=3775 RepID=A0A1Q3CPH3_CEPFO|nr:hypothetical protein CFOL_v3_25580 [Cephalotus follicularis]
MLLRNSIYTTKKFLQKSLESFKSLISCGGYQKLPKTCPYNNSFPYSAGLDMNTQLNHKDLEKFYTDFTDRGDYDKDKVKRRIKEKAISSPPKQEQETRESSVKNYNIEREKDHHHHHHRRRHNCDYKMKNVYERKRVEDSCSSKGTSEGSTSLVEQKLKEIEKMDVSNVDHVLDIEQVLHYYSRLTCPPFLDIVDKFFLDMCAEFLEPPATHARTLNLKPK